MFKRLALVGVACLGLLAEGTEPVVRLHWHVMAAQGTDANLTLARRGQAADCSIVVPSKATPSQRYAAEELAKYIEKCVGVRLPIGETAKDAAKRICISGDDTLGNDGFRLCVKGDDLHVLGGPRGVLYGVYEILERFCGIRWFSSWHEIVPQREALDVPADLDVTERPAFAVREPLWYDVTKHPEFAARMRASNSGEGEHGELGPNRHRFSETLKNCHTFNVLIPPEKYFDAHPEYFSFFNGARQKNRSQLCLTNPDVLRLVVEKVKDAIRREPGAKYFGVSQNDYWSGWCECEKCKAIDDEEESHAGTMIRFVNAVAAEVEREFPDKVIETLAYQYTRKPPKKTRARHNVMPCLCSIECDFTRPLPESRREANRKFVEDLRGWAAQTKMLYVWDYTTNYSHYPHAFPNVYALQGNLRFFRENGVTSVFEQGDYQGHHAFFAELKTWLLLKWMWNPDLPMKPLLDEFFAGYYGKAAPFVRQYFEEVHRLQLSPGKDGSDRHLGIFEHIGASPVDGDFIARADQLWDQAEAAVKDEPAVYGYNVRMGRFSSDYTAFHRQRKQLWVTRHPERFGGGDQRIRARRMLAALDETREDGVRISEGLSCKPLKALLEQVASSEPRKVSAADRDRIGAEVFGSKGLVDDPAAEGGKAFRLVNTHYEWSGFLEMNYVAFDDEAEYTVRVRLRADLTKGAPDGEVFWAGIYDSVEAKYYGRGFSLKASEEKDGYAWYEVTTTRLKETQSLYVAPGRFKGSATNPRHNGIYIDGVEIVRTRPPSATVVTEP